MPSWCVRIWSVWASSNIGYRSGSELNLVPGCGCTQWIWRHQLRIREPAEGDPVTAVTAACGGRRKMTGSRKILLLGVLARLLSTAPVPLSPAPERTRVRECVNHVVSTELQCPCGGEAQISRRKWGRRLRLLLLDNLSSCPQWRQQKTEIRKEINLKIHHLWDMGSG